MTINPKSKLKTEKEIKTLVREAQAKGQRVVFANGCFDLLHVGHIRYLEGAKALGDILILAINGDASVAAIKGPGRPLQSEKERAEVLTSLGCVDYAIIFDDPTADRLLSELKPDIHAKGTDYTIDSVPEKDAVRSYGGKIAIVGDPKDHSTRDLIDLVLWRLRP